MEKLVFDVCACGKKGFRNERDASRYVVEQRRRTEPSEKVSCPVGELWHVFNLCRSTRASYVAYLTATAGQPPVSRAERSTVGAPPGLVHPRSTACTKTGYGSERLAQLALSTARESGRDEKRAYQCPTCRRWHLSSVQEFFTSDQIEAEELLSLVQGAGEVLTASAGRYPDGRVAHVTLQSSRGHSVRLNAEHNRDREYNVGCLVKRLQRIDKAMAGEALVGLVARAALATDVVDTRAVRDVICAEPLVVHEDVSLREAADLMALGGADLLPVVPRSGVRHVLGVLTRSDLLRVARDRLAHDEVAPPTLRLPTRRRTRTVASGKTAPIVQR